MGPNRMFVQSLWNPSLAFHMLDEVSQQRKCVVVTPNSFMLQSACNDDISIYKIINLAAHLTHAKFRMLILSKGLG